ncbi:C40 family peptidase [uncultured Muribaculum sp.]|uniref:C40 family peptidase n=1 Tax=uncultured Muribaculum sp. TaxID=1918613 RepID=UPI00272B8573|nr:C40 family peptidase [uncultured Muribaculum sp.]
MRRSLYIFAIVSVLLATGCKSSKTVTGSTSSYDKNRPADTRIEIPELYGDEKLLVDEALTWLGTRYKYGGKDYNGTDCSGLTMQVYMKALGIALPRSSREQQQFCKSIHKSKLNAGDLVFFCTGRDKTRVSHVGLYVGNGQIIHSSASRGVIVSRLEEKYYTSTYHSSGHVQRKTSSKPVKKIKPEKPAAPKFENEPMQFDLDEVIEAKIDSIYSSFLD